MMRQRAIDSGARSRRGSTILEALIVVTAVAGTLGLCAVTIQSLLRLNTSGMARLSAALAFERLARQVREDAHGCLSAQLAADEKAKGLPAGLRLSIEADQVVTYRPDAGSVARDVSRAGKIIRHESYTIPAGHLARFELRDEAVVRWVALVVGRAAVKNRQGAPYPLEVLALLGKDRIGPITKKEGKPR
jgi:hypothetical protein